MNLLWIFWKVIFRLPRESKAFHHREKHLGSLSLVMIYLVKSNYLFPIFFCPTQFLFQNALCLCKRYKSVSWISLNIRWRPITGAWTGNMSGDKWERERGWGKGGMLEVITGKWRHNTWQLLTYLHTHSHSHFQKTWPESIYNLELMSSCDAPSWPPCSGPGARRWAKQWPAE